MKAVRRFRAARGRLFWPFALTCAACLYGFGAYLLDRNLTIRWADFRPVLVPAPSEGPETYNASAVAPDGTRFAAGSTRGTVGIWSAKDGQQLGLARGPAGPVREILFNHSGHLVAAALDDGAIGLWDEAGANPAGRLQGHDAPARSLAFSDDDRWLASGDTEGAIKIWEVATGRCLATMPGFVAGLRTLSFAHDGGQVVAGGEDGVLRLWDWRSTVPVRICVGHKDHVSVIAFVPAEKQFASGSYDGTARLWDASTGQQQHVLPHEYRVEVLGFSPDGHLLATGTGDTWLTEPAVVRVWDVATGKLLWSCPSKSTGPYVDGLRFRADGGAVAVRWSDGQIVLHQALTGEATEVEAATAVKVWPDWRLLIVPRPVLEVRDLLTDRQLFSASDPPPLP